jgi:hypothetical protein
VEFPKKILKNKHALVGGVAAFLAAIAVTLGVLHGAVSTELVQHPYLFAVAICFAPIVAYLLTPKEEGVEAGTSLIPSVFYGAMVGLMMFPFSFATQGIVKKR